MELPSENELSRLLERERPDPAEFRARTLEKLAEHERLQAVPARRAASFLPLGWLAGGWSPKVSSASLAGAVWSLPAVSLAMSALAFLYGLRAALGLSGRAAPRSKDAEALVRTWWREHAKLAGATLLGLAALAFVWPIEALFLVLLASLLHVAAVLTRLGREGAASRRSIGTFTAGFLGLVVLAGLFAGDFGQGLRARDLPEPWAPLALVSGAVACGLLAEWRRAAPRWNLVRVGLPLAVTLALVGWVTARAGTPDEARLVRWVERFDEPLEETIRWRAAAAVAESLRARGTAFDDSGPRAVVAEGARAVLAAPGMRWTLARAARAGLLPAELARSIAAEPETRALLAPGVTIPVPEGVELRLEVLVGSALEDAERERLAAALAEAWPEARDPRALEEMAVLHRLLERLGRPLPRDEVAADVHAVLLARWTGAGFVGSGYAASGPELASIHQVAPTGQALALIEAYGVPGGLEIERVERFLRKASSPSLVESIAPSGLALLTVQPYRYHAAALLGELRRSGLADRGERSLPARLADERLLLLSLALVLVCLVATIRAPAEE